MPKTIKLAEIDASDRLRPVDPDHAALIAAAIEENGLLHPLVVRPAPSGAGYALVAGAHRLAALADLGWKELEIGRHVVIDESFSDEIDVRIAEIDENLARHELNALDRALFIAQRKKLCSQRRLSNGGDRKSTKFKEQISSETFGTDFSPRFTVEVARKVGLSEDAVRLALRIAEKLDLVAIAELRGTRIERNQQQLLALCDLPADKQRQAAASIRSGEAKNVAEARIAIGVDQAVVADPQARLLATLLESWERASKITRAAFLQEIGAETARETAKRRAS